MASTPKKAKYESIKSGYIVKVSPLKTSQNNNRYFNATIQTSTSYEDLVNFMAESHRTFVEMSANRTPVTLKNVESIPSRQRPGQFDVKFSSYARLEQPKEPLPFGYNELQEEVFEGTIAEIKERCSRFDKVTVSAIVQYLGPTESVPKGDLKKTSLTIADHSDAISMTIWNDQRKEVDQGLSYKFTNISVRMYKNEMTLSTNINSKIELIQNLDEATMVTSQQSTVDIEAVTVENSKRCNYCKSKIDINELLPTAKCGKCWKKILTSTLKPTLSVSVTVEKNDHVVSEQMLKDVFKDCLTMETEELEDKLLLETKALVFNIGLLGLVLKK